MRTAALVLATSQATKNAVTKNKNTNAKHHSPAVIPSAHACPRTANDSTSDTTADTVVSASNHRSENRGISIKSIVAQTLPSENRFPAGIRRPTSNLAAIIAQTCAAPPKTKAPAPPSIFSYRSVLPAPNQNRSGVSPDDALKIAYS